MVKPRVSVVVPVYNLERYIEETLESLVAQTYRDYEAIIVDDGSTDSSVSIIRPYLKDRRFTYIHQPNAGVASARNRALTAAMGEWFALLDGDDIWMPDKLEMQMATADKDTRANLIYGRAVTFDDSGREYEPYWKRELPEGNVKAALYQSNFLMASSVIVKTDALREVGGFPDQRMVEDYDTWLRLALRGIWARACNKAVVRYRVRPGSLITAQIQHMQVLEQTLERALARETDKTGVSILKKHISRTKSRAAYEMARLAARDGDPDIDKYLWECWRYQPRHLKRFALAAICSISRFGGIQAGWKAVADRLNRNAPPWELDAAG